MGIFKTGNLYVDIGQVATGPFNVTSRGLELAVLMTPSEALEVLSPVASLSWILAGLRENI